MPKEKTKSKQARARQANANAPGPSASSTTIPRPGQPTVKKMKPLQYMTRMIERAINTMNAKITQLEDRISASSGGSAVGATDALVQGGAHNFAMPVQSIPVSSLYYPMSQVPSDKPKYPHKNKHPVTFIEDLTAYIKRCSIGNNDIIDTIIECLEGEARNWARIYKDRWTQFEDFKRDFLETYWGEAEQNDLRRKIVHNTWDKSSTMLGHFISLSGQAKMLTYPIQEKQLISDIMGHFPKEVQYSWTTNNGAQSILHATEFLRKLDNVNKQTEIKHPVQKPAREVEQRKNTFGRQRFNNTSSARQGNSTQPAATTNVISVVSNDNPLENNISNDNINNLNA